MKWNNQIEAINQIYLRGENITLILLRSTPFSGRSSLIVDKVNIG